MKVISTKKLRQDLNDAIRECKYDRKGRSESDHLAIDLEGKIYAYQFTRDVLMKQTTFRKRDSNE